MSKGSIKELLSERRERIVTWAEWTLVGFVFVMFAAACLHGIGGQWVWGHNGYNGAAFVQAARNSLRFEMVGQAQYYMGLTPPEPELLYTHHPMNLHAHLIGLFAIFGVHEWVGRLIPAVYSMLALVMVFAITRRFVGRREAVVASIIYALTPLHLIFANMINHEQGGIFWSLVVCWGYLNWRERRSWRDLLVTCMAVTMAGQFDWPAYYIAFFLALHMLLEMSRHVAVNGISWRNRPPQLAFLTTFSAVVLVNFFGFFAWIAHVRGGLDEMFGSFEKRSDRPGGYLERIVDRADDLHGWLLLTLLILWPLFYAFRMGRKRTSPGELVAMVFLLAQLLHSALFQQAGHIHCYWVYWFGPAIAIGGAVVLTECWNGARTLEGKRWARYGATAVVAFLSVTLLWSQVGHTWQKWRWGVATGSASYKQPYDDQFESVLVARYLGERFPRPTAEFWIDSGMHPRIEQTYYLDSPNHRRIRSALHKQPGEDGLRQIVVADLTRAASHTRRVLQQLATKHSTIIIDRRFVIIDGGSTDPSIEMLRFEREEPSWWWTWLIDPNHPRTHIVPEEEVPEEPLLAVFGDPNITTHNTKTAGGKGGRPKSATCITSEQAVAMQVSVRQRKDSVIVTGMRFVCSPAGSEASRKTLWLGGGGPVLTNTTLTCPDKQVPIGIFGKTGRLVDSVGMLCGSPDRSTPTIRVGPAGGHGGREFSHECPKGGRLLGVHGRGGALVDAVGAVCTKPVAKTSVTPTQDSDDARREKRRRRELEKDPRGRREELRNELKNKRVRPRIDTGRLEPVDAPDSEPSKRMKTLPTRPWMQKAKVSKPPK